MPEETSEAPATEVTVIYPDEETQALAEALDAKIAAEAEVEARAEPTKDDAAPGSTQAEEVSASTERKDPVPAPKPEKAVAEEKAEPEVDLKGLPDEWRDRFLKAHEAGVLNAEELAEQKTLILKGMGFDKKAREFADLSKDLEQKAQRGEQFDALFADQAERDRYLAWRDQDGAGSEPEQPPTFDTDEDLVAYLRNEISDGIAKGIDSFRAEQEQAARAGEEHAQRLMGATVAHFEELHGANVDTFTEDSSEVLEFRTACEMMNAEIRAENQLPWEVLRDKDTVARKIKKHLDIVRLQTRISEMEETLKVRKNEASKTEAARTAEVSSPIGRSTRTEEEYPDTPAGAAAKTLAEFEGRIPEF